MSLTFRRPGKATLNWAAFGALSVDVWVVKGDGASVADGLRLKVRNDSGCDLHLRVESAIDLNVNDRAFGAVSSGEVTTSGHRWTKRQDFAIDEHGTEEHAEVLPMDMRRGSIVVTGTASARPALRHAYPEDIPIVLNWSST